VRIMTYATKHASERSRRKARGHEAVSGTRLRRQHRTVMAAALVTALLAVLQGSAQAAQETTILASRAPGPSGAGGDRGSFEPSISANGRYVAFGSGADNLSADDDNAVFNVFVRQG
jgi:hypothetical protein